jgi:pSer/pThr/pTyr-binding forkhead associated (FHA) protein
MPEQLLQILKFCLLGLLGLFFLRVVRTVWSELKPPAPVAPPPPTSGPASPSGGPSSAGLRLRVVDPPERKGRVYDLADELTVGRAGGCGVALEDTTVSQLHARIFRRDGRLWVEDLGSTNGTFVNRKKVSAPVQLRRGDRLQVGTTVMELAK